MKYAFLTPFWTMCFAPDHYSVIIDKAEVLASQGHMVYLIHCDGKTVNFCRYNCCGDKKVCEFCVKYQKYFHRHITHKDSIKVLPISNFYNSNQDYSFIEDLKYSNSDDLKNIYYKQAGIGYAVLSEYLSLSRNLNPLIDAEAKRFFDNLLITAAKITDISYNILEHINPDSIGVFNSRFIYSRPIVDICLQQKRDFVAYEIGFNQKNMIIRKEFPNSTVHDINTATQMINDLWESTNTPLEEKIKVAASFFEKRRNAIACGDKVYVAGQEKGLLPNDWNNEKHNIVIFNSSEDEFAALGGDYVTLPLFSSQFEGISYLLKKYKNNNQIHFYLRIHPNLKDIPYSYHKKLYDFEKYDNVTVIPGDSPISTYSLMDNADKVVVFGSTTGAEAAYAHKPVILLGCAAYRYLDISYVAHNLDELDQLICNFSLKPKEPIGALKLAYYYVNDDYDSLIYFVDHRKVKKQLFGKKFIYTKSKIRGVPFSGIIGFIYLALGKYFWMKAKHDYPVKENPVES